MEGHMNEFDLIDLWLLNDTEFDPAIYFQVAIATDMPAPKEAI